MMYNERLIGDLQETVEYKMTLHIDVAGLPWGQFEVNLKNSFAILTQSALNEVILILLCVWTNLSF